MPEKLGDSPPGDEALQLRVLVVDDEPAITRLLCEALARRGLRVLAAHSAAEAKRQIAGAPDIGVVVSDIRMPDQTGLTLARDLTDSRADGTAIEVILVTGAITADDAVGALRARAFDVINKPFRLAPVIDVVERALASAANKRRRAARETDLRDRMNMAEAERHRLADRLEHSMARLEDTQSTLALAERARGDLFAVVHHELRTPLIPILGFSEIIAHTPNLGAADIRGYAEQITQGANQLLDLIDAALDILALDQGEGLDTLAEVRVARMVADCIGQVALAAAQNGVTIATSGSDTLCLDADPGRLAQALAALLDNAIKASPPGQTVWVAWDGGAEFALSVLDRGPGVPPGVIERLGTPFLQGDMSSTRAWPGAGLGLALVLRIARAHGGRLELRPRSGGGTEAILSLPQSRP